MDEEFDFENRIVSSTFTPEDNDNENALRPHTIDEYIGQEKAKENLKIMIGAAKLRGEPLSHILFYGPPGLGKTTLSMIIAQEMGVSLKITAGPAIEKKGDLASILTSLSEGDVLFIDEIHRLPRTMEEILYPAMEDFAIDFVVGTGPGAHSIHIPLAHFTLVGATTRAGQLSRPLRDRFGGQMRLELYTPEELSTIVKRSAAILDVPIDEESALKIASRSRGTPRIANRLLKWVRDYSQVRGDGRIALRMAQEALEMMEIDELGLDRTDRRMLETIIRYYGGGPVGLTALAATIGEEAVTLEDVCEPYLLQIGFLARTLRGRMVTRLGYEHLGIPYPEKRAVDLSDLNEQVSMESLEEEED